MDAQQIEFIDLADVSAANVGCAADGVLIGDGTTLATDEKEEDSGA